MNKTRVKNKERTDKEEYYKQEGDEDKGCCQPSIYRNDLSEDGTGRLISLKTKTCIAAQKKGLKLSKFEGFHGNEEETVLFGSVEDLSIQLASLVLSG